jgi:hypothetical protein
VRLVCLRLKLRTVRRSKLLFTYTVEAQSASDAADDTRLYGLFVVNKRRSLARTRRRQNVNTKADVREIEGQGVDGLCQSPDRWRCLVYTITNCSYNSNKMILKLTNL